MLAALIGGIYLSRTVKRHFGYKRGIEFPTYSQKVWAAVGMLAGRGIIPAAFFGAFLLWLLNTKLIISSDFGILLKTIAVYLLYYYLSAAIVKVTFTPFNGKWRIIEVCDNKARKISSSLIFRLRQFAPSPFSVFGQRDELCAADDLRSENFCQRCQGFLYYSGYTPFLLRYGNQL